MKRHPTAAELKAFAQGDLSPRRALEVTLHLVDGCASCQPFVLPSLDASPSGGPGEDAQYGAIVQRVFQRAREKHRAIGVEREQVRRIAAELTAGTRDLADILHHEKGTPLVEALLEASWSLRYQDPAATVAYARCAATAAADLALGSEGAHRAADLRCRAWAELGNALRITGNHEEAEESFDTALGHWTEGSHDETLFARYLDLRASLHRARRDLNQAQAALAVACAIYLRYGQKHLAGRTLLNQATFASVAGEPELALQLVAKGLSLVDEKLEPDLVVTATHNQIWFLVECGRFDEARKRLFVTRGARQGEGRVSNLKLRWVEGRIEAGRGQLTRAEAAFREVRDGFESIDLGYQAASVTLDLAASVLRQGRAAEACGLVVEAAEAFTALRIHREMLMAVLYLKETVLCGAAEVPLLEEVAAFLRRAEHDGNARFEPRAAAPPRSW